MKLPDVLTPVSLADLAAAMRAELAGDALSLACAHVCLETGWMKSLHCFNLGNAKSGGTSGDWTFYPCGENLPDAQARGMVAADPARVSIVSVTNGIADTRFLPEHPMCRFRAFASLAEGVAGHVAMMRGAFPKAWASLQTGDARVFAAALKSEGYFTADLDTYAAGLAGVLARVRAELAAADTLPPPPAPPPAPPAAQPDAAPAGQRWVDAQDATDDEIRAFCASILKPWAGLSAKPETLDAYNAIEAPVGIEGAAMRASIDAMWSCALTVRGYYRRLLETAPQAARDKAHVLYKPYVGGAAMVDVQTVAEAFGAERAHAALDVGAGVHPQMGDPILVDGGFHVAAGAVEPVVVGQPFATVEGGDQITIWKAGVAHAYKAISAGRRVLRADGTLTSPPKYAGESTPTHAIFKWIDIVVLCRGAKCKVLVGEPAATVATTPAPPTPPVDAPAASAPPETAPASPDTPTAPPAPRVPAGTMLQAALLLLAHTAARGFAWCVAHPWYLLGIILAVFLIAQAITHRKALEAMLRGPS